MNVTKVNSFIAKAALSFGVRRMRSREVFRCHLRGDPRSLFRGGGEKESVSDPNRDQKTQHRTASGERGFANVYNLEGGIGARSDPIDPTAPKY